MLPPALTNGANNRLDLCDIGARYLLTAPAPIAQRSPCTDNR